MKRLLPAIAGLVGVFAVWYGVRALVWRIPGAPGFEVAVTDARAVEVAHARVPVLMTPEVPPTPPPGASLVARATFFARVDGTYTWNLGATSGSSLAVDGKLVYSPRPGRVAAHEQALAAGLHALEITVPKTDAAGGVAFGVRPPWQPWRGPLAGAGDVVAAPVADVSARLGTHAIALVRIFDWAPTLAVLLVACLAALAAGRERRRRALAHVRALLDDPLAQRVGTTLLLAAIVWPLVAPFAEPGFFACQEEESYIVRLQQYEAAIRFGVPMGRWWPDPIFGRGYPFLCLYAPLLYILATPFLLLGFHAITTIKIISVGIVAAGTAGTYHLVRRRASRPAALLAAALFTYAPYLQTDLWIRQDLAESLGFGCLPLALLTIDRALDAESPRPWRDIAFVALSVGALGCCHNITAYFSLYFLALWFGLRVALRTTSPEGLRRTVAGAVLAILLASFYALPAMGDRQLVFVERIITGYYNALVNFSKPGEVLWARPRWGMRLYVGVAGTIAVVAGLAAVLVQRRRGAPPIRGRRPDARLLAILGAAGVVLTIIFTTRPLGRPIVKYVPLAKFVAFPWRLYLFAACFAPLCAPVAVDTFWRTARERWLASLGAIVALMVVFVPWYGPPAPLVRSHLDVAPFLRSLETDYVTSMNEYLPRTVTRTVPRFGDVAHVVSGKAAMKSLARAPGRYEALVEVVEPAVLEFNAHWFPGWRARIDGKLVPIGPGEAGFDGGGLIRVRVPIGRHDVTLGFGRTPLRLACDILSLTALFSVLVLLGLAARDMLRSRRAAQVQDARD